MWCSGRYNELGREWDSRALVQWIHLMGILGHTFQSTFSEETSLSQRRFYATPQQCTCIEAFRNSCTRKWNCITWRFRRIPRLVFLFITIFLLYIHWAKFIFFLLNSFYCLLVVFWEVSEGRFFKKRSAFTRILHWEFKVKKNDDYSCVVLHSTFVEYE